MLSLKETFWQGVVYLVIYNTMFILPLVIIFPDNFYYPLACLNHGKSALMIFPLQCAVSLIVLSLSFSTLHSPLYHTFPIRAIPVLSVERVHYKGISLYVCLSQPDNYLSLAVVASTQSSFSLSHTLLYNSF
ncbi:hypothetical protein LCGC14_1953560, partial [marine sediment metagenome]